MSKAFRFHLPTNIAPSSDILPLSKRKLRSAGKPILIGADSTSLSDARGRRPIESYADIDGEYFVTLTCREADLIALSNPGTRPPQALEEIHPWLPQQVYKESSEKNYEALKAVVKKYGAHFFSPSEYCDRKWNTVFNSVRKKTAVDARFYTAWHLPIQDTYVLEENRPDRCVIALDYNAMYPFCMQKPFPNPSKMYRQVYDRDIVANELLPAGLYRCELHNAISEFIKKHNPFRSFFAGRHLRAALNESLFVDLNEFEIAFFHRHFERIFVSDAVVSDQTIPHPLAREARRCFARRAHFRSHGHKALANREKFLSTLLSSCTHRPSRLRHNFSTPLAAEHFLRESFGISLDADDPDRIFARWLHGRKAFIVAETDKGIQCDTPNIAGGQACFVFNQRIVARSRIVLLEMMERISGTVTDAEICYANVDSVHFSLPDSHFSFAMEALRCGASDQMGDYKIETISKGGLWLEPGRYWLFSEKVEKFRNRCIRHHGSAFTDHSIHVINRKIGDLHIPIRLTIKMENSMSDMRSIDYDALTGLERQCLITLEDGTSPSVVLDALELNRKRTIPRRVHAFKALSGSF